MAIRCALVWVTTALCAMVPLSRDRATAASPVTLLSAAAANGDRVEARLDAAALGVLRGSDSLAIRDFPLGPNEAADLHLTRFEVLAPDAVGRLGFDEQPIDRSQLSRYFRAKLAGGYVMIAERRDGTIDGFIERHAGRRLIVRPTPMRACTRSSRRLPRCRSASGEAVSTPATPPIGRRFLPRLSPRAA